MITVFEKAIDICNEFCKYIIIDHTNGSILVNVEKEYHSELVRRLDEIDVMEVLSVAAEPKTTLTCTFLIVEWEFSTNE